jgi:hypothetical protein
LVCGPRSYSSWTNSTLSLTVQSTVLGETRIGCPPAGAAFLWCLSRRRFIWSIIDASLCGSFSCCAIACKACQPSGSSGSVTVILPLSDDYHLSLILDSVSQNNTSDRVRSQIGNGNGRVLLKTYKQMICGNRILYATGLARRLRRRTKPIGS